MATHEQTQRTLTGKVKRTPDGLRFFAEHDPEQPLRLTSVQADGAVAPEAGEQDLARHEGKRLRVGMRAQRHGWVYGVTEARPATA